MRLALTAVALVLAAPAYAADVSRTEINRIIVEGTTQSQVMDHAFHLTDRIGGRLTNSPAMREAERWTAAKFREWGLSNVRAEPFQFGRGWSMGSHSARITGPRPVNLTAIPVAWTPGTNGTISAPIVVAPIDEASDFARWRGKLNGRIVLLSLPGTGAEPTEPAFKRYSVRNCPSSTAIPPRFLARADQSQSEAGPHRFSRSSWTAFFRRKARARGCACPIAKAIWSTAPARRTRPVQTPALPGFEMSAEDYRRLTRLARTDAQPVLELMSENRFHDEDTKAYNIVADIPGTDRGGEYVMAGAHLDSWVAADGAVDNAAGSAVVMEAARILRTMGVRPKRTIRFALWSGEEQGLLGSLAYVDRYLATRPPETNPALQKVADRNWRNRFPVSPKPGHRDLVAISISTMAPARFRGIHAEGNVAAMPIFSEWLAPFASMGATTVAAGSTGGTDHVFMQSVGIPAYQFIQDPLDYGARLHHTSIDTYDHLKADDLRQAAVIMAAFLLNAANRADPLPRMPVPSQPRVSDPFEYLDDDD
jgi:hypothetical protein